LTDSPGAIHLTLWLNQMGEESDRVEGRRVVRMGYWGELWVIITERPHRGSGIVRRWLSLASSCFAKVNQDTVIPKVSEA
jgi:hypothetical protein